MKSTTLRIHAMAWFLLVAYSKMQDELKWKKKSEREMNWKRHCKATRNQNLMIWKTLSLSILQKMRKHVLERTPMKLGQPLAKEIRHVIYGSNQPFLQKPGIEMGFSGERLCLMVWISSTSQRTKFLRLSHQQKLWLPGMKGTQMGWNRGKWT